MNACTLRGSSKGLCDAKRQRRNFTSSTTLRVADSSSRFASVAAHAQGPRKRSVGDIATNGCEAETSLKRREALNWGMMVASASYLKSCLDTNNVALADEEEELTIFWGAANPPATYGGTARTKKEFARYSFIYPSDWKEQPVNKVEKGTNGTDCRLAGSKRFGEQIYIVVLQRLGEDFKGYQTNDVEKALSGIAVADANLQDALAEAEDKTFKKREADGQTFYDLDLKSTTPYYITLTNDGNGRYFALFITATSKGFSAKKDVFGKMRESFRTYVIA